MGGHHAHRLLLFLCAAASGLLAPAGAVVLGTQKERDTFDTSVINTQQAILDSEEDGGDSDFVWIDTQSELDAKQRVAQELAVHDDGVVEGEGDGLLDVLKEEQVQDQQEEGEVFDNGTWFGFWRCGFNNVHVVANQTECKVDATAADHTYFEYREDAHQCGSGKTCDRARPHVAIHPWANFFFGWKEVQVPRMTTPQPTARMQKDMQKNKKTGGKAEEMELLADDEEVFEVCQAEMNHTARDENECQVRADKAHHRFVLFEHKTKLCHTSEACESRIGTKLQYKIYHKSWRYFFLNSTLDCGTCYVARR